MSSVDTLSSYDLHRTILVTHETKGEHNGRRSRSTERKEKSRKRSRSRDKRSRSRDKKKRRSNSPSRSKDRRKVKRDSDQKRSKDKEKDDKNGIKKWSDSRDVGAELDKMKIEKEKEVHKEVLKDSTDASKKVTDPADLEELMRQKTAVEAQELKPKFLTKQERRELALKKRHEQVQAILDQQEADHQQRVAFFSEAERDRHREKERERDREHRDRERSERERSERERSERERSERERSERERLERERERERLERERGRERSRSKSKERREQSEERDDDRKKREEEREKKKQERGREKEREEIKKQYMGIKEKKRRFVKPSEKFKFVFEWDLGEDTSRDNNPLYNNPLEARPQFGRGYFAGIDKREQLKRYKDAINATQKPTTESDNEKKKYDRQLTVLDKQEASGRHWSEKKVVEMTARDWRIFKEDYNISTKGGGIPNPIRSWDESGLPDWILNAVKDAGYKKPTPVQMQAIPIGLQGRDILGVAETGSGKTAAFVLPMLVYISKLPKMTREMESDGPYALVLAPTRELASQIEMETKKFAKYSVYRTVLLVGGQPIEEQAMKLRKGCEIIIATPGRLNDCLESRYVVLNQCNYIVLDEADRMIDMGFEQQVIQILESMPKETLKSEQEDVAEQQEKDHRNKFRTTLMFSATMPPEVERLSRSYLRRPGTIYIGIVGRAVDRIKQTVLFVKSEHEKKTRLEQLLRDGPPPPIIIFVNQRKTCDSISKYLNKLGYRTTTLQGGRTQDQREWSLSEFREGRYDILVATDVAGRGLDVKGVTHVINYDLPKNIEQYTHRVGRTGRAGESGLATSFFDNEDHEILFDLKRMLQDTDNPVPHELSSHPDAQMKPGGYVAQSRRDTVIYAS